MNPSSDSTTPRTSSSRGVVAKFACALIIAARSFILIRPFKIHCLFSKLFSDCRNRSKTACAVIIMARALIAMFPSKLVAFSTAYNTVRAQTKLACALIIVSRTPIATSLCKMHYLFYISIIFLSSS